MLNYFPSQLRALILLTGIFWEMPESIAQSNANTANQWQCVNFDGEWLCQQTEVEGERYALPFDPNRVQYDQTSSNSRGIARIELDWVPLAALSEEKRAACPRGCDGAFQAPIRSDSQATIDPLVAEIQAEAGATEIDAGNNLATLSGDVTFTQGWRQVSTTQVTIDRSSGEYRLEGDITIREPGVLLVGDSAQLNGITGELSLQNAEYVLHDVGVRGSAQELGRNDAGTVFINNGTYSTCEPGDDGWLLYAQSIELTENGMATAKNMTLTVEGVPVFYFPRFTFPTGDQRASGLLYPSVQFSGDNGLDFTQPYYLNLAENFDATLAPRYVSERGAGIESEFRWLTEHTESQLSAMYLSDGKSDAIEDQRWLVDIQQQGQWGAWVTEIDAIEVSDIEFFEDLGSATLSSSSQTYLRQHFSAGYEFDQWTADIALNRYQTLVLDVDEPYWDLPRINLDGHYTLGEHWYANLEHQYVNFAHTDDQTLVETFSPLQISENGTYVSGQRIAINHELGWKAQNSWSFFAADARMYYRAYQLDDALYEGASQNPSAIIPSATLDTGIFLQRPSSAFDWHWTQTLEPRIQLRYTASESQDDMPIFDTRLSSRSLDALFRDNQFVGGDRVDDAQQITLGLTTRMINQVDGRELVSLSIGQSFYLNERQVHADPLIAAGITDPSLYADDDPLSYLSEAGQLALEQLHSDRSDLVAEARLNVTPEWSLSGDLFLDEEEGRMSQGQIELGFRSPDNISVANLAIRHEESPGRYVDRNGDGLLQSDERLDTNIQQLDFSSAFAWGERWTLLNRFNYDFTQQRTIDAFLGASYANCCWNLTLVWRHWLERDDNLAVPEEMLDYDSGIFINFQLVGFAGLDQSLAGILEEGIPGFHYE